MVFLISLFKSRNSKSETLRAITPLCVFHAVGRYDWQNDSAAGLLLGLCLLRPLQRSIDLRPSTRPLLGLRWLYR